MKFCKKLAEEGGGRDGTLSEKENDKLWRGGNETEKATQKLQRRGL